MNQEYKLSGKSGNLWLTGLLVGLPATILMSIIYAYIDVYNPFVYLTILVFLGYLFGILMIQTVAIRLSKCRSESQAKIFGAVIGLFAIYANWATFLFVQVVRADEYVSMLDLFLSPALLFEFAGIISEDGWFQLFDTPVSGAFLWIIWLIEAGGILGAGVYGGSKVMHEEVFCENCNRWAEDTETDLRLTIPNRADAQTAIQHDINKLLTFPVAGRAVNPQLRINLHHCSNCKNFSTIDVDLIKLERNDKGEIEENDEDYSPVLLLSNQQYKDFLYKKNEKPTNKPKPKSKPNSGSKPNPKSNPGDAIQNFNWDK